MKMQWVSILQTTQLTKFSPSNLVPIDDEYTTRNIRR